jgi:hypothetical protein
MFKAKNKIGMRKAGMVLASAFLSLALAVPTVALGAQPEADLENYGGGRS